MGDDTFILIANDYSAILLTKYFREYSYVTTVNFISTTTHMEGWHKVIHTPQSCTLPMATIVHIYLILSSGVFG